MSANIITGYTGSRHITPSMDASVYRSAFGDDHFITAEGDKMAGSMPSINEFTVKSGVASMQGHMVKCTQETLPVDTCANGYRRIDLVCLRYTHNTETQIDEAEMIIIKGTEVAEPNMPTVPEHNEGIIDSGASVVDFPLYRINLSGSSTGIVKVAAQVESLADVDDSIGDIVGNIADIRQDITELQGTVPVSKGGTGATSATAARVNLSAMAATPSSIEFNPEPGVNHGGYLDFHFQRYSGDYSSRIIEQNELQFISAGFENRLTTGHASYYNAENGYSSLWGESSEYCQLGKTTKPWRVVYAVNGVISGSDRRLKKDISDDFASLAKVFNRLRPVHYQYANIDDGQVRIGFIAQEIESAMAEEGLNADDYALLSKEEIEADSDLARFIGDTTVYSLNYSEFVALNTAMIQNLQKENDELNRRLTEIEERLGVE